MASMVASVPELVKRHMGNPYRSPNNSATSAFNSHGVTNSVPLASCSSTARRTTGLMCPLNNAPKPMS
ncbi:unannotated protein [freshwater metagenome]|uniref:Unannotated protein n=1 Tax=freshwater metagenome TaxID=449393 RepID=A0A6J6G908_9ZZZZ